MNPTYLYTYTKFLITFQFIKFGDVCVYNKVPV